jgi:hypothetical protein
MLRQPGRRNFPRPSDVLTEAAEGFMLFEINRYH